MKILLHRYSLHIEELRAIKNIPVLDFVDNICSDRQYRRFLSGTQFMKQTIMFALCRKLNMRPSDFLSSFNYKDEWEFQQIVKLYSFLVKKQYDNFVKYSSHFRNSQFYNIQSERIFHYCFIRFEYETKIINKYSAIDRLSKLIDYPKLLNRSMFDFVEVISLNKIAHLEVLDDITTALNGLRKILSDTRFIYISSNTRSIFPNIYSSVARMLGVIGDIEGALITSKLGITYSINNNCNIALSNLYYTHALSLFNLGRINEAFDVVIKCLASTISKNNIEQFNHYLKLFKKDMNIDPLSLFYSQLENWENSS